MGLFNFSKKNKSNTTQPAPSASALLYPFLFCDDPALFLENQQSSHAYPFSVLADNNTEQLEKLADDTSQESRIRLLALHQLRKAGRVSHNKEILGVVVEVALRDGLDVLAAYADGTARFLHHTGRVIIWEDNSNTETRQLIDQLFAESVKVVAQIGPWHQPRRPAPAAGMARISFLVADGLYFGEAPINHLFADPLAAPALQAATALMQWLIDKNP